MKPRTLVVMDSQETRTQRGMSAGGHQDQRQTDAVDAEAVMDRGGRDPGDVFGELHVAGRGIE